jgi:GT2 family glycosyltransferase/glycosyltransferase involved in cell wall biosynthesis
VKKPSAQDRHEALAAKSLEEFFDPAWYSAFYSDVAATGLQPIVHFIRIGIAQQRDPNRFFASRWYLEQHQDVRASGIHPLLHYLQSGAAEQRSPHPDFDVEWYIGQHPQAAANPLLYHIRIGQANRYPTRPPSDLQDHRQSEPEAQEAALIASMEGFFDAAWYQQRYPDIASANLEPIAHFIRFGAGERRDPNPFFDSNWYLEHNPDVSASGIHPLLHYLRSGAAELRNPHPNFDAVWYASQHPEAAANPLLYHTKTGRAKGHLTEKPFDIGDYLPSRLDPPPRLVVVVDVVIPVYRGLTETMQCIASVLAAGGKPLGRVIVIEDRSPDPELVARLVELAAQGAIHLIRNPTNLGFVGSVNIGMQAAGNHDVVLLNSDTGVPPNQDGLSWLARLAAQAYAQPRIATVSPLSNNATICGWPDDAGGPIAFAHTLQHVDAVCREVNAGRWVDAPTTVGFCMYIRRKALREVGMFDTERFTVGYGEENDFCLRAAAAGWHHRIACDTFVYHKGSVSFAGRVDELTARAMVLLLERYPTYQRDIARYVALGDITPFRFALTAALFRESGLPVILMVSHGLGGGVRRHIETLVARFHDTARFVLLEASHSGASLSIPALPNHPSLGLPAKRLDDLATLLRSMNVSRVHLHHLLAMDMDIQTLIRRLDVPFDVTVHDYFAICPQINLLPWRHSLYCGEPDLAGCNACIAHRGSHGARDILTWRAEHAWQFRQASRVLCPSQDVLNRLQRHGLAANAVFAPHEPVAPGNWQLRAPALGKGRMRIAVLGALPPHKGGRTVAAVAEMADPKIFEIHLIGYTDGPFSEDAQRRMKISGRYDDADLAALINKIDPHLIWFPAAWPETFSYTLSAALEARTPVAASRIGSFTERLDGRPLTWLADVTTSPAAWIALFGEIRNRLVPNGQVQTRPAGPAPKRTPIEDFYATRYLAPPCSSPPIHRNTRRKLPRIVVVPERFDVGFPTPCAYIRLLQPLHHPAVACQAEVVVTDINSVFDHPADIIITQRYAIHDNAAADRLAAYKKRIGATLVFDLDDDLLRIPRDHPDARELRPRSKVVRRMLQSADTVWLSTQGLADRLAVLRPDTTVLENCLDERIWTSPSQPSGDRPVRILCMGTTSHDHDFAMIEPALTRLKAEYGDRISIDILGMTSRNDLPAGLNRMSVPVSAIRSYPGFVQWLTSVQPGWHIGLAPLLTTPFNLCKSAVKAMDYAALGVTILASDTPVYRGSLADGPAGCLVANNAGAWYAALDRLVRDTDMRCALANRARAAFLAQASLASRGSAWRNACMDLLKHRHDHAA